MMDQLSSKVERCMLTKPFSPEPHTVNFHRRATAENKIPPTLKVRKGKPHINLEIASQGIWAQCPALTPLLIHTTHIHIQCIHHMHNTKQKQHIKHIQQTIYTTHTAHNTHTPHHTYITQHIHPTVHNTHNTYNIHTTHIAPTKQRNRLHKACTTDNTTQNIHNSHKITENTHNSHTHTFEQSSGKKQSRYALTTRNKEIPGGVMEPFKGPTQRPGFPPGDPLVGGMLAGGGQPLRDFSKEKMKQGKHNQSPGWPRS